MTEYVQIGQYLQMEPIARGGFATVFKGWDPNLQRDVAIKEPLTQLTTAKEIEAFWAEAKILGKLNHQNIIQVLNFLVKKDGTPCIIMRFAPDSLVRRFPPGSIAPLNVIISLVNQMASALDYAHTFKDNEGRLKPIVHRDIKPANILISTLNNDGLYLLSDFGIFVVSDKSKTTENMGGTIAYMAPEQVNGHPIPASDQYALGIVVYELLNGRLPYTGTWQEVLTQILSAKLPPAFNPQLNIHPLIQNAVHRTLLIDPMRRYPNCTEFANEFSSAANIAALAQHQSMVKSDESHKVQFPWGQGQIMQDEVLPTLPAEMSIDKDAIANQQQQPQQAQKPPGKETPQFKEGDQMPNQSSVDQRQGGFAANQQLQQTPYTSGLNNKPLHMVHSHHLPTWFLIANVAVLLLLLGGGILAYTTSYQPYVQGLQHQIADLKHQTADLKHQIAVASENPYTHSGTLTLSDPLQDNSKGYSWDENPTYCVFMGGTYYAMAPNPTYFDYCLMNASSFGDFTVEVQMWIIKGDGGGIVFRQADNKSAIGSNQYSFDVYQDGTYVIWMQTTTGISKLASGSNAAIKHGLNQGNLLAVIAKESTITVYVNQQRITSVTNNSFSSGHIGFEADPYNNHPTIAAFSNIRVWT